MKMYRVLIFLLFITLVSCDSSSDESTDDSFDRGVMLTHWADNIIIPAYQNYELELKSLKEKTEAFEVNATEVNLISLRDQWESAYLAWQWVAMFEIGKAETLSLQSYTNLFPTNTTEIGASILSGDYNLELPSRRDQQGFPAIDYLINGLGSTDAEIVSIYNDPQNGTAHKKYLTDIVGRLFTLTSEVVSDWEGGYRDAFVDNDGSSATGAVNKVTNDYIYYFERHLRASKIGIPAGVFSGTPDAKNVEAYYSSNFSKSLYEEALTATRSFFNGQYYGKSEKGESFSSYLNYLNSIKKGEDLVKLINGQFDIIETKTLPLSASLSEQVQIDNELMLNNYDELQKNVINLKVDMLQALNIKVDYVDADGD